jgi:uncharacterized repeat protein (TIGR03803 family)
MRSQSEFHSSVLSPLVTAIVVALFVLLAVISARPQNPVPPTAREAAALREFAAKLHPATRPAMNKPRAAIGPRAGRPSPLDIQVIYENGPVNGTVNAWSISYGYIVSDSFVPNGNPGNCVYGGNCVNGFDIYLWELPGDSLTSLDWSITTQPNGGTVLGSGTVSGANLTDQFISTNQLGYDIDNISATGLNVSVTSGNPYWINLFNASVPSGDPVYWDENSGVGCHSNGCPSQAYQSTTGTIPSEAFDITHGYPLPPCFESEENMQIIHDFSSQKDGGSPAGGVVADPAGNTYGAVSGGQTGYGFVYEIASKGQGWLFNILYNFTGGSDGAYPNAPIIGPHRILYGTAAGGCCGLVYSLRPAPTACLTAICSWTENVLYRFADDASAGNIAACDQQGNLYGVSGSGGMYGKGAVFELMPSPGGWTETILYSFAGGSDGGGPGSVLVGQDGNLYGAAGGGGANNAGVVFQLVRPPSGGNWTENVIYSFSGQSPDGGGPSGLIQDGGGNLLGFSGYYVSQSGTPHIVLFMLSPSNGSWVFSVLEDIAINPDYGEKWTGSGLATDTAGNVYWADAFFIDDGTANWAQGGVYWRPPGGGNWYSLWDVPDVLPGQFFWVGGTLGVDASGNVYGTTSSCGKYNQGTVWRVAH